MRPVMLASMGVVRGFLLDFRGRRKESRHQLVGAEQVKSAFDINDTVGAC
jgi:hypothetical protein